MPLMGSRAPPSGRVSDAFQYSSEVPSTTISHAGAVELEGCKYMGMAIV